MTVVFVNGNPETPVIWDLLAERLAHAGYSKQIRLAPPGFGAPIPPGFEATVDGYLGWLVGEIEALEEPVDLVGHDVGGSRVIHLAMRRPDLIRTWVSDTIGTFDPDYEWHELAQIWQRKGAGEAWMAEQLEISASRRAEDFANRGMDPTIARQIANAFDASMANCILSLYRSSRQPTMANLGRDLGNVAVRPGLSIFATLDGFVGAEYQHWRSAKRAGANLVELKGSGHWWMTEDQGKVGSEALISFWRSQS